MLAYAIGLLIGEKLRDHLLSHSKKGEVFRPLFATPSCCEVLQDLEQTLLDALDVFTNLVLGLVPTHV